MPDLIFPVFLPQQGCPQRCIYCDQHKISGSGEFDPEHDIEQAESFIRRNPHRNKQIAFYGGSFTALPASVRASLLQNFATIADPLTSFRVSTHPDYIDEEILCWCRQWGIKTIELGIQDFDTEVLAHSRRGYTGEQAFQAAELVKREGFELGVQLMPGLPGWSKGSTAWNHKALSALVPDLLRLYPVLVIKGTPLEGLYRQGKYTPLGLDEAITQCADYFSLARAHQIRIIKLGLPSNLDPRDVVAGPWHPAFGELVKAELLCRRLQEKQPRGGEIPLLRAEAALLKSHSGFYQRILAKRIGNCTVRIID